MKKIYLLVVFLLVFPAAGCSLMGPSEEDIKAAYEAVLRGMEASTKNNDKPEIHSQYANAADVTFKVPDNSTLHNISIFLDTDDGSAHVKGDCTFTDYTDTASGYKINGVTKYEVNAYKNKGPEDMYGEVNMDVRLDGGKIKSLAFMINKNKDGTLKNSLKANGKKIDLDKWAKAFEAIKTLNPMLSGT